MKWFVGSMLLITGLIHLPTLAGVLGAGPLARLYGLDIAEPNLAILMRHRAVILGMLGLFFIAAAFRPAWQPLAVVLGLTSVASFLVLAGTVGGYNSLIARVVYADWAALACLVAAGAALIWKTS